MLFKTKYKNDVHYILNLDTYRSFGLYQDKWFKLPFAL